MILVQRSDMMRYESILKVKGIRSERHPDYKKWLRYYVDYCAKYPGDVSKLEQLRLFELKLQEKGQSVQQRQQAVHAVFLYFEMLHRGQDVTTDIPRPVVATLTEQYPETNEAGKQAQPTTYRKPMVAQYHPAGYQEKSDSPEWDEVLCKLADEIKVRHYSRKTLQTYALWSRQFQRFLKDKPPSELTTEDVKDYLTFLAVKCHVAASTQNQALNCRLIGCRL